MFVFCKHDCLYNQNYGSYKEMEDLNSKCFSSFSLVIHENNSNNNNSCYFLSPYVLNTVLGNLHAYFCFHSELARWVLLSPFYRESLSSIT